MENLEWAHRAVAAGRTAREVSQDLQITEQTYYRWKKVYGASRADLVKQIKHLTNENTRLRRMVAEQILRRSI